jgi:NAD(P)-dependent dehydrogenase (short-subunit alcohol dehydrogenase family)
MPQSSSKTVLITGASTGIGRQCALDLAARGWRVFAGVRKAQDGQALIEETSGQLVPLILDVTDYAGVATQARKLEADLSGRGLDGLVNNAGISISGPLECMPMEMFERQMRVNVSGQLAVTQAFLPLLRQARGRIVFMSSESGRFTLPMLGAYSASKFALEAMANAFRFELFSSGIRVSLVEPGSIQTPIWQKSLGESETLVQSAPRVNELYGDEIALLTRLAPMLARAAIAPEHVARAVRHALGARRPKVRYIVGMDAHLMIGFFRFTPARLADFVMRVSMRRLARRLKSSAGGPKSMRA